MSDPILVATVSKNSREQARVTLSQFHGHSLVDLRIYAPVTGLDVHCPTKKGLSVSVHLIDQLTDALNSAKAQAIALGWLEDDA